jgi:hypothetical protein
MLVRMFALLSFFFFSASTKAYDLATNSMLFVSGSTLYRYVESRITCLTEYSLNIRSILGLVANWRRHSQIATVVLQAVRAADAGPIRSYSATFTISLWPCSNLVAFNVGHATFALKANSLC